MYDNKKSNLKKHWNDYTKKVYIFKAA